MTQKTVSRDSLAMTATPEQRLVIAFSMLDVKQMRPMLDEVFSSHLNWPWIIMQAMHHRTLTLQWTALKELDMVGAAMRSGLPKNWIAYCEQLSRASLKRNEIWLARTDQVFQSLDEAGIDAVCIKGAALIGDIYTPSNRMLGDIDCLALECDRARIRDHLYRMGFQHGMIDPVTSTIKPISREKLLFWRMNAHIMPKFTLRLDDPDCPFLRLAVGFDFFDPGDSHSYSSKSVINNRKRKSSGSCVYVPDAADMVINLCAHIFREGTSATMGYAGDNWNLWKFCDFRSMLLKLDLDTVAPILGVRLQDSGLARPFYYALYYTDKIYGDPDLKPWFRLCETFDDNRFLYEIVDGNRRVRYERPFAEQLFETGRVVIPGLTPVWAKVMNDGEWW